MWDSFKENVQSRFSSRTSLQHPNESTQNYVAKDAMKNVVTPHSIPQFIVPPLDPGDLINSQEGVQSSGTSQSLPNSENPMRSSMQRLSLNKSTDITSTNKQQRSVVKNNKPIGQQMHPGLSLQHLLSVKAGFSTLTESPNTRRKESLFLSPPLAIHGTTVSSVDQSSFSEGGRKQSSGSERSRNASPIQSSFESFRNKRMFGRTESESNNSSRQSTPFSSPAIQRKISSKKSLEIYAHCNSCDSNNSPTFNRMNPRESNNKLPRLNKYEKDDANNKFLRSYSESSTVGSSEDPQEIDHLPDITPRIKLKLTYLSAQEKMNISILEAQNFFVGHSVYFKLKVSLLKTQRRITSSKIEQVALLPRYYGYQRTDQIKVTSPNSTLRERLTFEFVKDDDISLMSLEVSCKEKQGRLRSAAEVGKSIITLSDIDHKSPNEIWLELNPPDLKESIHMQLSLCYDAMLGFVVAEVISVRNIPKGSLGRYPDSYVVLTEEPQCDKNKKKQTEIKYRSKDPTFNQSFVFSMSNDRLIIVATLFIKDKVKGHWTAKGEVKLGQDVEQWSGQSHWAQVLAQAGKPVTLWHLLTPL